MIAFLFFFVWFVGAGIAVLFNHSAHREPTPKPHQEEWL